jgi:hypothetical protein
MCRVILNLGRNPLGRSVVGTGERGCYMPLSRRTLWIGAAVALLTAVIVIVAVYSGGGGSGY